ncbi:MAG: precorrin-3B C(17)-methyltransferase [Alphaproteobacteria bacterium]|nr:precorrin-3B C(17)-methyltransferase [Alphaproteobacteria bacterium]
MTEAKSSLPEGVVFLALTREGYALARRLASALPGAEVHGYAPRVGDADTVFSDLGAHLRDLFTRGHPIVGLCAAGILIRALAPALCHKAQEPSVVALAEDGGAAVPLLGGHRGGNALATFLADQTGGVAAVTTAGELRLGLALDIPPPGWRLANREIAKTVTAALLAEEKVALRCNVPDGGWLTGAGLEFHDDALLSIRIGADATPPADGELLFHPPVLALGVGCERQTEPAELEALVTKTLAEHDLSPLAVACVCSIDLKSDEAAVHALAESLGVPARFFDATALEAQAPRLQTPSPVVFRETGCHGVCEGAALAAAGEGSELVIPKAKSARATCALAMAASLLDAHAIGAPRGELAVIGIGPGAEDWRTPEASAALSRADDVVGYDLYFDLVAETTARTQRHTFPLGKEEERARAALDLAAAGKRVALISSGDAGIYAMASLVFELLHHGEREDWSRVKVTVVPGISALQAAAARIGAPLGHDFCAISLSDLLTPREDIAKRVRAAAEGDFVVAFYNPVSRCRRDLLEEARDILLFHRPADTPVVLARNLGRPGEEVAVTTLEALTASQADMLTLVLVGNSHTVAVQRGESLWVYTPRGYGDKEKPVGAPSADRKRSAG